MNILNTKMLSDAQIIDLEETVFFFFKRKRTLVRQNDCIFIMNPKTGDISDISLNEIVRYSKVFNFFFGSEW